MNWRRYRVAQGRSLFKKRLRNLLKNNANLRSLECERLKKRLRPTIKRWRYVET